MPDQPINDLIPDSERAPLDESATATSGASDETAFGEGVLAARMGMEKDDNPYPSDTHASEDWETGYASSTEAPEACVLD
jgi:hypothetical protein